MLASLLFVAAVYLSIRMVILLNANWLIDYDGIAYLVIARGIYDHWDFSHPVFSPGYPAMVALVYHLFPDVGWEMAARLVPLAMGLFLLVPLYLFSEYITNSRAAAHLTLLLYSVLPITAYQGVDVQGTIPAVFFVLSGLAIALRNKGIPAFALAGIMLGMGALVRPEILAIAFMLAGYLMFREAGFNKRRLWMLVVPLLALLVYSPYVILQSNTHEQVAFAGKAASNQFAAAALGAEDFHQARVEVSKHYGEKTDGLLSFWFSNPLGTARNIGINGYLFQEYMLRDLLPYPIFFLFVAGLLLCLREVRWGPVIAVSLAYLPVFTFLIVARHLVPLLVVWLPVAGLGLVSLFRKKHLLGLGVGCIVCILAVASALQPARHPHEEIAYKEAGLWIKANDPGKRFFVRNREAGTPAGWACYYADGTPYMVNFDSHVRWEKLPELIDAPVWLVLDNKKFLLQPQNKAFFSELINGGIPAYFKLEHIQHGVADHLVYLVRVHPNREKGAF